MLDLDFLDILATIGIGVFMMITLIYLYFLCIKLFDIKRHNEDYFFSWLKGFLKQEYKQTGYTLISSILIFSAGILTQDFTDHLADSEGSKNPVIRQIKQFNILKTEGELRMETLIEDSVSLNGLGKEIFNNKKISFDTSQLKSNLHFFNTNDASEYWKLNGRDIFSDGMKKKALINYINGVYYTAKNWCILKAEPVREELIDIQMRIDLSRSVAIISFLTILAIIVLFLVYCFWELIKGRHRFKILFTKLLPNGQKKTSVKTKLFIPVRALLILLSVFVISRLCYEVAENNYNERALGYYISHLKYDK